jgi:hypothetical protein
MSSLAEQARTRVLENCENVSLVGILHPRVREAARQQNRFNWLVCNLKLLLKHRR